ncbi:MAG: GntG family PLP-dependent aldolase [bacterium]
MIDLRSDTITRPTQQMRHAMANAEVGDDVFGDDPTVNLLEETVAEILGKEAALFVPSGTMANQIAVRCHTQPGDEVLLHEDAHHYFYETGGAFVLSGVVPRMLRGDRGMFTTEEVERAIRPDDVHFPSTTLLCVENTTNRGGGAIWPIDDINEIKKTADKHNLKLHMDGARLWNASVASGIPEKEYAKFFDTVNVCFSKGLGAPIGSAVTGSIEIIKKARKYRKLLGGGMRQAGIIAAGALFALDHHRERLADDHRCAKQLAEGIAGLPGIEIDLEKVETNIVIFFSKNIPAKELVQKLFSEGIWVLALGDEMVRAVTNMSVYDGDIERTIKVMKRICV